MSDRASKRLRASASLISDLVPVKTVAVDKNVEAD